MPDLLYVPYTYLIGWTALDLWYYGVQTRQKGKRVAHPSNLWESYFTSSKKVALIRKRHGEPDVIQVRKEFSCRQRAWAWEQTVIHRMRCTGSPRWLNAACFGRKDFNADPDRSVRIVATRKKNGKPWHAQATKEKIAKSRMGKSMNLSEGEIARRRQSFQKKNIEDLEFLRRNREGRARRWADPEERIRQRKRMLAAVSNESAMEKRRAVSSSERMRELRRKTSTENWTFVGEKMKKAHAAYFADPLNMENHRHQIIERYQIKRGWSHIIYGDMKFETITECAEHLQKCIKWVRKSIKNGTLLTLKE